MLIITIITAIYLIALIYNIHFNTNSSINKAIFKTMFIVSYIIVLPYYTLKALYILLETIIQHYYKPISLLTLLLIGYYLLK